MSKHNLGHLLIIMLGDMLNCWIILLLLSCLSPCLHFTTSHMVTDEFLRENWFSDIQIVCLYCDYFPLHLIYFTEKFFAFFQWNLLYRGKFADLSSYNISSQVLETLTVYSLKYTEYSCNRVFQSIILYFNCMEDNINQFCQGISVFSFIKHTDIWFVKKDKNKINLSIYFYQKDYIIHIKQKIKIL